MSASHNQRVTNNSNDSVFIAGNGNNWGSQQFSGSMMEFRYWSEPLSQSVFNNHVRTPKAYNGNTTSSAYDNLLLRLPLDDNISLSSSNATLTASNIAHIKTYQGNISGSNINGFTGNFYRDLVDQEKVKVPKNEINKIKKIINFIYWFFSQPKNIVGGRNFSLVNDKFQLGN